MEKGLGGQKHLLLLLLLDRTLVKKNLHPIKILNSQALPEFIYFRFALAVSFFFRFLVSLLLAIHSMILATIGEKICARIYLIYDTQDS